jgi:membrane protein insertase Oxa1/YidC/SpoIIIJ
LAHGPKKDQVLRTKKIHLPQRNRGGEYKTEQEIEDAGGKGKGIKEREKRDRVVVVVNICPLTKGCLWIEETDAAQKQMAVYKVKWIRVRMKCLILLIYLPVYLFIYVYLFILVFFRQGFSV